MSAYECCPNYSYAKRGYACSSITAALTSNRKFFPPNASIYNLSNNHMLQYPGYSGDFITAVAPDQEPEQIKSYFHKAYDATPGNPKHARSPNPIEKICPGCRPLAGSTPPTLPQ